MDGIAVRVNQVWREARNVVGIELVPLEGGLLPTFDAGAHIDVWVGDGLCRQYSLLNDNRDRQRFQIAVKLEANSKGGSAAMHGLKPGDALTIGQPRNNFPLAKALGEHIMFAGGIGVTPFVCMMRTLARNDAPFHLHFFMTTEDDFAGRSYLASPGVSDHVTLHVGLGPSDVDAISRRIVAGLSSDSHVYLCGPSAFMECIEKANSDIRPGNPIQLERFTGPVSADEDEFEVVLARSGQSLTIPVGRSILDVLLENGTDVDYACQKGVCGTCIVRLLNGAPDHRDMFLTAEERIENKSLALCVSRSKGRLVLDL